MARNLAFGRWLQQRRNALSVTQAELAQCVGCATVTIRKIELEERRPSKEIAERLAICLQIADDERAAFLRFARGERSTIQPTPLPPHVLPVPAPSAAAAHAPLPVPATPLLGREREVASLTDLLCRADVRLVTLLGPGGIGKTRLALEVAADLNNVFTHGAVFVALAALTDPTLVLPTMARTLGVTETGEQPLQEQVIQYLRDKHLLLVLDNVEHLIPAAPVISTLLTAAPYLTVLVTSRAVLHLSGEHEFPVAALSLPDLAHLPSVEHLPDYAAIRLFRDRAEAVNPSFQLTNANAAAVAEICIRLDGLPLAIELAAARSKVLPSPVLLARLRERLSLLTGGARDLPARQHALRSTIDWSYQLLDPLEQTLFARLAVFVGGCTLDTAEAVCHADPDLPLDVLDGLHALIDKSLLQRAEVDGELRFTMLGTIRDYALEQLGASGEAEVLRTRHAAYYVALVEQAHPALIGPHQGVWIARLEREHANLRAALRWSLERGDGNTAVQLSGQLWRFWYHRGHLREGRYWLDTALAAAGSGVPSFRAEALNGAGVLAGLLHDVRRAQACLEASLALFRAARDTASSARVLNNLGFLFAHHGEYARARGVLEESVALYRGLDVRVGVATALGNLGWVLLQQGEYARARPLLEESLTLHQEVGHTKAIADTRTQLGWLALQQGNYRESDVCFAASLALHQELGNRLGIAQVLNGLGWLALTQDEWHHAQARFRDGLSLAHELGQSGGFAQYLEGFAAVATVQGHVERAARLIGTVDALHDDFGIRSLPVSRAFYEHYSAATRAQLGQAAVAAAWAQGRAMTVEQAIAYVLTGEGENRMVGAP